VSAEVVRALEAEAHRLDAAHDNDGGEPLTKADLAEAFRNLALRTQGTDPAAARAAELAQADAAAAGGGLAVEKTDADGNPVE
jgi:hypothetical protein